MKEGIYSMHFGYLFFIYSEICKRDESKIKEYVLMRKGGLENQNIKLWFVINHRNKYWSIKSNLIRR